MAPAATSAWSSRGRRIGRVPRFRDGWSTSRSAGVVRTLVGSPRRVGGGLEDPNAFVVSGRLGGRGVAGPGLLLPALVSRGVPGPPDDAKPGATSRNGLLVLLPTFRCSNLGAGAALGRVHRLCQTSRWRRRGLVGRRRARVGGPVTDDRDRRGWRARSPGVDGRGGPPARSAPGISGIPGSGAAGRLAHGSQDPAGAFDGARLGRHRPTSIRLWCAQLAHAVLS